MEPNWNTRVLIVDDQEEIHTDFREMLTPGHGKLSTDNFAAEFGSKNEAELLPAFALRNATSGDEAFRIIVSQRKRNRPVAVAFVDIRMNPGIDGVETVRRIRTVDRDVEVVLMTAHADKPLHEIARDMERFHKLLYIRKPFAREVIQQITLSLVTKWNIERELADRRRHLANSHQRLRTVLDATGDAIAMYDGGNRLLYANKRYERLAGATERELARMSPDATRKRFRERFRERGVSDEDQWNLREGRRSVVERVGPGRETSKRLLRRAVHPVHDDEGEKAGSIVVYRDLSVEVELERMTGEVRRLRGELESAHSFEGMVGSSSGMQRVQALMRQAAGSDITVLVRGESGTGKELVARLLHFNGPRRSAPFVAVNCAAVSESLMESELFGHERGAFTGAASRRAGCFERANGGTILLDEIGDMSLAMQAKLLRVLQEREIQRLGGTAAIPVDVRVVAATNTNLEAAMDAGAFRQDLYFRVAAFPITVPPLRERAGDIRHLVVHFLSRHARRSGRSIHALSSEALQRLEQHDWPGNVRELDSAIRRAVLLETTQVLQESSLPPELLGAEASRPGSAGGIPETQGVVPLVEVERRALLHALEVSAHNVSRAARALGINRATLHRKLKKYDLSADD